MKLLKDCLRTLPLLILGNSLYIATFSTEAMLLVWIVCGIYYAFHHFFPYKTIAGSRKLAVLSHGLHELRCGLIASVLEIPVLIVSMCQLPGSGEMKSAILILNPLVWLLLTGFGIFLGLIRIAVCARQIHWYHYAALLLCWWIPVLNFCVFSSICRAGYRELYFERAKLELDDTRCEIKICQTKYPILMVHGIFFRDWQYFNYWGRIPAALQRNGAKVYYGGHQSSRSIADSAQELAVQVREILRETGAEKLNIIAHSKGGLDIRYAIDTLGLGDCIASVTTINTPHSGCAWVDMLLRKAPPSLIKWVAARYEAVFCRLGDEDPDFLAGVKDLTVERCEQFNAEHPLPEGIFFQCYMSEMCSVRSAPFPLWLGYILNQFADRRVPSDGLVSVRSAALPGVPLRMVPRTRHRGVSHGDMIDLMRENIPGFDVREFYVQLVRELCEMGY